MSKVLNRIQNVGEYLLALAFVLSAVELIGADPLTDAGLMAAIFGGSVALYMYMVWFAFIGVGLIYAKVKKKRKLHLNLLLAIYLTTIFTSILSVTVFGFAWPTIIDDLAIGLIAGVFWLRWKFRTEYIRPERAYSQVKDLGGDPPPLP